MKESLMGMRHITSEQQKGGEVISGEINKSEMSLESEIALDLKGNNAADEWLVFVEENVGKFGGDAAGIIDKIKNLAKAKETKNEEESTVDTLSKMRFSIDEINEKNKINLNEFIKMLEEVKGDSTVVEKIIEKLKRLEGLMDEKNIDLSESEAEVSKNLNGIYPVESWIGYFDKRIVKIDDDIKKLLKPDLKSNVHQKEFNNILINKLLPNLKLTATIMTGLDTLTEMTKNQKPTS